MCVRAKRHVVIIPPPPSSSHTQSSALRPQVEITPQIGLREGSGTVVVLLNILVLVLVPLQLLMKIPALFKAMHEARREGKQVQRNTMSASPPTNAQTQTFKLLALPLSDQSIAQNTCVHKHIRSR